MPPGCTDTDQTRHAATTPDMALRDASCYTLTAEPSRENPAILELKENNGEVRYARVREKVNGEAYATALYGE